jgi:hypothetical protein
LQHGFSFILNPNRRRVLVTSAALGGAMLLPALQPALAAASTADLVLLCAPTPAAPSCWPAGQAAGVELVDNGNVVPIRHHGRYDDSQPCPDRGAVQ